MAHQKQIAIADDGLEQVVEIMRYAAGQFADRFHLLRLGELRLQRLLLRCVDDVENGPRFAVRTRHEGAGVKLRAPFALLASYARVNLGRSKGGAARGRAANQL